MQLLLQNFICLLRDSHTARTSWSLKKRMDFLLLIVVNYIHAVQYSLTFKCRGCRSVLVLILCGWSLSKLIIFAVQIFWLNDKWFCAILLSVVAGKTYYDTMISYYIVGARDYADVFY